MYILENIDGYPNIKYRLYERLIKIYENVEKNYKK